MTRRVAAAIVVCWAATAVAQQTAPVDELRAAWRYRREVVLPAGTDGAFAAIAIPPDVAARSQRELRDLRLVDGSGREAPYVVMQDVARIAEERTTGRLVEARQERRESSTWAVDFGTPVTFDRLELEVPGREFVKRVAAEVSTDGTTWQSTGADTWIFDRQWQGLAVHRAAIEVPATTARFARLTLDDSSSRPLRISGVAAARTTRLGGSRWDQVATLERMDSAAGHSRYRVAVPPGWPVRRVTVDADDAVFARRVEIIERKDGADRTVGTGTVYRLRVPDDTTVVEMREVEVDASAGGELLVDVTDGDSPPLVTPQARLSGPQTLLLTSSRAPVLTLYYGNPVTRAASYDVEHFRPALARVAAYPGAALGAEAENPRYRQPTPLAFAPDRGATLDASGWRYTRAFTVSGGNDLYSLTLDAGDAAHSTRDLADLRIVDEASRQVPYVMERGVVAQRLPLEMAAATPRQNRQGFSAVRVTLPASSGALPLSLTAIELRVQESFFTRQVTVLVPSPGAAFGQREIATRTVSLVDRDGHASPALVSLDLGEVAARELTLEIQNGDNAPLTLVSAAAVAPVPRLTFKGGPGTYRLLLGADGIQAPSYELGRLRQDVLDYTAVPLPADALAPVEDNPDYRRRAGDVIRDAPPALVLWGALGLAVVVLLALTRRILSSRPTAPPAP